ncbi:MAG TPA: lipoprotein-releasing ABC transporter permease subunit [Gammaproteobacteria bacterium]|nr:lipoprotein-releasing ABC transporter permease subunit [Gammaproteobacteria bacterium]
MFNPVELYIGLRYLRAKRRNHFISVISLISVSGIALGVMALIVVLSVMNGFQTELRSRILSMTSHATVTGFDGTLRDWEPIKQQVLEHPRVVGAAPYVEGRGMLTHSGSMSGVMLRGILPEQASAVSDIGENIIAGSLGALDAGEYGIVLGQELAYALGVGVGDSVILMIAQGTVTPAGFMPRLRRFDVVGIFKVGMYEYDRNMAIVHMDDAARMFLMGDAISGVRMRLDDMFNAPQVTYELSRSISGPLYFSDWTRSHANFFRAIQTEKTVMFVILTLIVAVAAFNIISTLVMVVTDKQADIAILRTLGLSPRSVMVVFMVQGLVIGLIGTIVGVTFGVLIAANVESIVNWLEQIFQTDFLPASVYYISSLPSEMQLSDVVTIGLVAFVMTFLSTLYPSWRAARTQPAEALRYE